MEKSFIHFQAFYDWYFDTEEVNLYFALERYFEFVEIERMFAERKQSIEEFYSVREELQRRLRQTRIEE